MTRNCTTHHACDCITERNRQLETALRELVEAVELAVDRLDALPLSAVADLYVGQLAAALAAANSLLATPKGEDDAE